MKRDDWSRGRHDLGGGPDRLCRRANRRHPRTSSALLDRECRPGMRTANSQRGANDQIYAATWA